MYNFDDKKKPGNDQKKEAKLHVLKEMRKMASDMMGNDLKNGMDMKKVTVAAPTKEGLKKGLTTAEEVLEGHPGEADSEEEEMSESEHDSMTDWSSDLDQYSEEELKAKIEELQAAMAKKK